MKQLIFITFLCLFSFLTYAQRDKNQEVNKAVDNVLYWNKMIKLGKAKANPEIPIPKGHYNGSTVCFQKIENSNSPDILIYDAENQEISENSIFVNGISTNKALSGNNGMIRNEKADPDELELYVRDVHTLDEGQNWEPGGYSEGSHSDPSVAIDNNGNYFMNFIEEDKGQSIIYSTNNGDNWSSVIDIAEAPGSANDDILDKSHLTVDNIHFSSPYEGHLYVAWTEFDVSGGEHDQEIMFSRCTGINEINNWSEPIQISQPGDYLDQGVNLQVGPSGVVYAAWSIYENNYLLEDAIGFAKSLDGGQTFEPAIRAIDNLEGIRPENNIPQWINIRVNAFPSMAVDISSNENRGNIYIVFPQASVSSYLDFNISVYMIKSEDAGETWSEAIRVNQDQFSYEEKVSLFPWITCDPITGTLHVVFYSNRNFETTEQNDVYIATSYDAGESWTDYKISDADFTFVPIPGAAPGYFTDYIGISSRNGYVYPIWTDNRTGEAQSYCSPFTLEPLDNLIIKNEVSKMEELVTYQAKDTLLIADENNPYLIEGDGNEGSNVTFKAGDNITMKKGFSVQKGANFSAYLEEYTNRKSLTHMDNSSPLGQDSLAANKMSNTNFLSSKKLKVLQNPNYGTFEIEYNNYQHNSNTMLSVYDLMGKLLYAKKMTNSIMEVDLSMHQPSTYIIRLVDNNKIVASEKIFYIGK